MVSRPTPEQAPTPSVLDDEGCQRELPTIHKGHDAVAFEKELAACAKALAHPARIRLIRILAASSGCLGYELIKDLDLTQSTVSEHLRILKKAGFVHAEIHHPRTCFSLNRRALEKYQLHLGNYSTNRYKIS